MKPNILMETRQRLRVKADAGSDKKIRRTNTRSFAGINIPQDEKIFTFQAQTSADVVFELPPAHPRPGKLPQFAQHLPTLHRPCIWLARGDAPAGARSNELARAVPLRVVRERVREALLEFRS